MTTTPPKHCHWFVTEVVSHVLSDTVLGFCIFNMLLQINTRFRLPIDIPYELILVNQSPGVNISVLYYFNTHHWYLAANDSATNGYLISIR